VGQDLFSYRLLRWHAQHGRHDLPWQQQATPYRVWVSEIMLQQTQVATVIPYYARFMQRFPNIAALASASQDAVLQHWAGLGYYARGRNIHKAAGVIAHQHRGRFPQQLDQVQALPGIGRSTAGAILALSLNQRHPILDGNVKRSLCRYHGIEGFPGQKAIESQLWQLADQHTPQYHVANYTQAIMDMGAILCTRSKPDCPACPHRGDCRAYKLGKVHSLPTPRPKKIKPKKRCYMPLLSDCNNRVILFRRPSKGIWGGLYSLPEFQTRQHCGEFLAKYDIQAKMHTGQKIQHSFTHFDLTIEPLYLSISSLQLDQLLRHFSDNENHRQEVNLQHATPLQHRPGGGKPHLGVPAPVLRLLEQRPIQALQADILTVDN